MTDTEQPIVTAGVVVIGDEILSGRTRDTNSGTIAAFLTEHGIDLREVRVVPDDEPMIVEAVRALSGRYTYVFTCGGIGPTHDDITADAVAKAFEVGIDHDPRVVAILKKRYENDSLTEARMRMARIPAGADLIDNPVSGAPGFRLGNVHVLAGVPKIMQAMLDSVAAMIVGGAIVHSVTIECPVGEGLVGGPLAELQRQHPDVSIGSYPVFNDRPAGTRLVVRSRDAVALQAAAEAVAALVAHLTIEHAPKG
jgi:molybdenum cofactor synthesis domain-containing protein